MRYLRKQVLNRRAPYDTRFYMDATDGIVLANSNNITLPKSNNSIVDPVQGMIRYNTTTNEVQVYQGSSGSWRSIRYKESTGITQQTGLGPIDGLTYFYGPLNPAPPAQVQTGTGGINVAWGGQNILVLIGNVLQIFNTNYVITQNPNTSLATTTTVSSGTTLDFSSTASIPQGAVVTGSANIPVGTTVTVTSSTQVTLSNAVTGTVSSGTTLSFAKSDGYYLNFTSDPNYSGMIGQPITVLHGFDQ
jgi:hypothetical protein